MSRSRYSVSRLQSHGYVFILPTLIFFSLFLIYPMISAFRYSLFEWNLLSPMKFVGLKNFANMIKDPKVINSYVRTLHFSGISVAAINVLAFVFALMFSSRLIRFKNSLQSLIFLPVVLSIVAVGVVWEFMYQSTGLISVITRTIFGSSPAWLTSTKAAPYAMIITYVWKSVGYYMVMYIAGLMDVPVSLYEAARIDGAGFWSQLIYVTIPNIKNTIALGVISCIIFTFGQFAIQFVITKGGPSRSTEILALLIYNQAFQVSKFGYSAAISVLFFLTLLIFSIFQLRLFKSGTVGG
ncbi:MAG: sugar ABC transporter permease [Spirochaetes bacterium]|jgi:multiple sugar transport system permease protein|nr:sugar ABC transporter permease [Acidobacteriota bacterium]MCX7037578.1 sugar ABC transporter permease [Spirochaetota bacterium]